MRNSPFVRWTAMFGCLALLVFAAGAVMAADSDADLATSTKTSPEASAPSTTSSPTSSAPTSTEGDAWDLAFKPDEDRASTKEYVCWGPPIGCFNFNCTECTTNPDGSEHCEPVPFVRLTCY